MQFDAIVIGGGYAGMSAGLQLARARRKVIVVDSGRRRNRFAGESHGFLTRDGEEAATIAAIGREQLLAYPTVEWADDEVTDAGPTGDGFYVELAHGGTRQARRLVIATGVSDELPSIPGIAERWGKSVFHCPYCHGYELDQGRIGLLASGAGAMHLAQMLPDWGITTLFLNGSFEPSADELARLSARAVTVDAGLIDHLRGDATVVMGDGREVEMDGLFLSAVVKLASPLAGLLGCDIGSSPAGEMIVTDMAKATSVPGVYACGDTARMFGSLAMAVSDGAIAGGAVHQSLIFGLPA